MALCRFNLEKEILELFQEYCKGSGKIPAEVLREAVYGILHSNNIEYEQYRTIDNSHMKDKGGMAMGYGHGGMAMAMPTNTDSDMAMAMPKKYPIFNPQTGEIVRYV